MLQWWRSLSLGHLYCGNSIESWIGMNRVVIHKCYSMLLGNMMNTTVEENSREIKL